MPIEEFGLDGRQAVVIGGGRGIGRGIAHAMAEAGAEVAVVALTPSSAEEAARRASEYGPRAVGFAADATDGAEMDRLAEQVLAAFPKLSILVNCVGDAIRKPIAQAPDAPDQEGMSSADWHRIIDLNITSIFEGCRVFGPHLLRQRTGSVLNVSGVRALRGRPGTSAYGAGKAAITRLTESAALEWAPYGVRVNAIAPGLFPDPEREGPEDFARRVEQLRKGVPLGRVGHPRDAGLMAVYLASDAGLYLTGQTLVIDGGASLI